MKQPRPQGRASHAEGLGDEVEREVVSGRCRLIVILPNPFYSSLSKRRERLDEPVIKPEKELLKQLSTREVFVEKEGLGKGTHV